MSQTPIHCQSCGMTIDAGDYCRHCVDDSGRLQGFEERFARWTAFALRKDPGLSRAEAEARTLESMATMPAWREHPELLERLHRPAE